MGVHPVHRPEWEIDKRLKALIGENVRVRAELFWPPSSTGKGQPPVRASSLVLPDNTTVDGPLFFEGRLKAFLRKVALVFVELGQATFPGEGANGRVLYRGTPAVILQAPATVQLHSKHFVEKIPADPKPPRSVVS